MDRNTQRRDFKALGLPVALRKESVDRNALEIRITAIDSMSLSARRAWIEIILLNLNRLTLLWSLSARRAWIEITQGVFNLFANPVALRKESVDRNLCSLLMLWLFRPSLSARRAWIEIPGRN